MTYRLRTAFVFCFVLLVALSAGDSPGLAQSSEYIVTFEPGTLSGRKGRRRSASWCSASIQLRHHRCGRCHRAERERSSCACCRKPTFEALLRTYPVFASQSAAGLRQRQGNGKGKPGGGSGGGTSDLQTVPAGCATRGRSIRPRQTERESVSRSWIPVLILQPSGPRRPVGGATTRLIRHRVARTTTDTEHMWLVPLRRSTTLATLSA